MDDIKAFIARAHAYSASAGLTASTVSRKLLGNGKRLGELEAGKSLRVDTLVKANGLLEQLETTTGQ